MKKALYALALLFCLFPYTQILSLDSYNQPYAIVFCTIAFILAIPRVISEFPRRDLIALTLLAAFGIAAFVLTCLPRPTPQEFKYLLIYISPLIFTCAAFSIIRDYPHIADRLIAGATIAWGLVGVIQTVVDPSFFTQFVGTYSEAAEVVVDSGRGTLGLAPEPTHFGFHMIILAALVAIVGGRNWLSIGALVVAIVIARSSSALLALALGSLIYLLLFGRWWRVALIAIVPAYYLLGLLLNSSILPEDLRIVQLLSQFYADPLYLITSDGSANARLGGIYVGLQEIARNGLIPAGLSGANWLAAMGPALARNPWLIFLSDSGVPSGILVVIYQLGVIGLLLMGYFLYRMISGLRSQYETLLVCSVCFVFLSQYYISTPGFGVLLGAILASKLSFTKLDDKNPLHVSPNAVAPSIGQAPHLHIA